MGRRIKLDKIILAILMLKSRTIYEIRKNFENSLNLMYSSSMGSIQAAVKKLIKEGYIVSRQQVENGKCKNLLEITENGKEAFKDWVNAPFSAVKNKNPELAKLYFMGLSDKKHRAERIYEHIRNLEEYRSALQAMWEEAEKMEVPEEYRELFEYQHITVKYGIDSMSFEIEWHRQLAKRIEKGKV